MSEPDPAGSDLLLAVDGPVATLSINRPAKRNALTVAMWRRLAEVCAQLDADPAVRVLVVTGAGPSFCAGADISSLSEDEAVLKSVVSAAERALRNLPMPTIARISGHCFGGGNQIAVACDLRVADTTASFGVPPARLGVIYPVSSTRALVELVGPAAAKRLILTGQPIDAAQALRIGLVEQVVAPDELDAAVAELVAAILPLAPMTQVAGKELVNLIADGGDADAAFEEWTARWRLSADGVEGPRAFLARRPPVFSWRREPAAGPEPG
ncbi:enoyl-CoA hydratase/isomerase family protein [Jatrophihabitans sp.]|uniref:enoyl-CoA hydratase/isomerase family protein n=1 Tax=Jatrophihabitans sp. TaxID=1932789 RepID=UPI002C039061|nr:enoyl-CoA hydratase-related protein [Jatrophihabitans sp.]